MTKGVFLTHWFGGTNVLVLALERNDPQDFCLKQRGAPEKVNDQSKRAQSYIGDRAA